MKFPLVFQITPLLFAAAVFSGCEKNHDAQAPSQVAVKVNAEEITVHQVNNILARTPGVTPEESAKVKREILNRLIDQQLAKQHAIDKKLDRSPSVMQAIEAARSEILARAYLEQLAAAQPKPTAEEVANYYTAHPELFSKRRIFNLEQIQVMPKEGLAAGLREQVAKVGSMQDIVVWLRSQDAKFTTNHGEFAAEQIALDRLVSLQAMKDGELGLAEAEGRLEVFHIVATHSAPVDETTAAPRIQQFLANRRSSEVIAAEMKRIRETANIVYVGEFVSEATAAKSGPAAKAELLAPGQPAAPDKHKSVGGTQ